MVNSAEMAGIAVVAVGAMIGEMAIRRRKRRTRPKARSNGPLPKRAPVFLGHDLRWTPSYSPDPKPDAETPPEERNGFARI